jgi:hypothetical protein
MKQKIIVDILDDGEVKIETRGFKGPVCLAEAQFLKDILGEETQRKLTPMFYETQKTTIKKHISLCG